MCNPALIGMGIAAAGTAMQSRETNKNISAANKAKEGAFEAHQIRQGAFQDEAGAAFNTNLDAQGQESFDADRDAEADKIKSAFGEIRTTPDYNVGLQGSAPKNVVVARERESANASDETDRDVSAFAKLNGYKSAQFNSDLSRSQFGRAFGNTQDEANRDVRLLSGDLVSAAANSQKSPSALPVILKAGGQALSMYGAANPNTSFMNTTVQGPLPANGVGPGAPVTQPGLFSQAFGGL